MKPTHRERLSEVDLSASEARELEALASALQDRVIAAQTNVDASYILFKAAADAIYDRDFIACAAASETAKAMVAALNRCGEESAAVNTHGAINVLAFACTRLLDERQAAS